MRVIENTRLELGEGPGFDPATNTAWWFDIERSRLYMHDLPEGTTPSFDLRVAGSAMAVTEEGRHLVVAADGLYFFDPENGEMVKTIGMEEDNPATRSNDARVHPSGHFWVSTMGWKCEPQAGSIYLLIDGKLETLFKDITIPNAICFSPSGDLGYYTDTRDGRIMSVQLNPETGRPVAEPEVFVADLGGDPDGAVTDAAGNFWVTLFGEGRVVGYSPDGTRIGEISVPAANVTCPAFIGPDARQMLVTTALYGMSEKERAAHPGAGLTYATEIDFAGRFDPPVRI